MHTILFHWVPRFLEIIDRKCCILSGPPCIETMIPELCLKHLGFFFIYFFVPTTYTGGEFAAVVNAILVLENV